MEFCNFRYPTTLDFLFLGLILFHNDLGLIFVAVYQHILQLLYVDDLLSMVKQSFSEIYDPKRMSNDEFDDTFRQLRLEAEARGEEMRKTKTLNSVKKQGQVVKSGLEGGNKKKSDGGSKKDDGDGDNGKVSSLTNGNHKMEDDDSVKTDVANGKENVGVDVSKLAKLRSKGVRGRGGLRKYDSIGSNNKGSKVIVEPKKATKKNRVWDDSTLKPQEKLDFTDENGG